MQGKILLLTHHHAAGARTVLNLLHTMWDARWLVTALAVHVHALAARRPSMAPGARQTRALERPGPRLQRERPVLRGGRPTDRISGWMAVVDVRGIVQSIVDSEAKCCAWLQQTF